MSNEYDNNTLYEIFKNGILTNIPLSNQILKIVKNLEIMNISTTFAKNKNMNIQKLNDRTFRKAWYLHFKDGQEPEELKGERDFLFGTKAAMYEVFDRNELGIALSSLQCHSGDIYQNGKVIMRRVPFITKKANRYNLSK